ncbi:Aste57867_20802 [Aphanomyces stellatus]|uniref:Aste57867_20802 protein n=1 Tax=Aphanomyces stellatus TaxID=120398 RepID=A0A485LFZ7_9STRA|nr:hypothetical protein As57867_020734 [Aphanomyces stellatus]VFT97481.1 Aste57867_20802 [Aphanomyces stellatus]
MKSFSAIVLAAAVGSTQAFWDNGHMLVGEIATQHMDDEDVGTIHALLDYQEKDFPNTNTVTTAAIWPDLIKCNSLVSTYCPSPLTPSLGMLDIFHYVDLPVNVNGTDYHGLTSADVQKLFDAKLDGFADDYLDKALKTMNTTHSLYAANFVTRMVIHIFGDIHQPLHAVGGVSDTFPKGDAGGNFYVFKSPCVGGNLHAIWDSVYGKYGSVNWSPDFTPETPNYEALVANATALVEQYADEDDKLDFESLRDVDYTSFVNALSTGPKALLKQVMLRSYDLARDAVYADLDLNCDMQNGRCVVPCPSQEYGDRLVDATERRIVLAGKRLGVILSQFARRVRQLNLLEN